MVRPQWCHCTLILYAVFTITWNVDLVTTQFVFVKLGTFVVEIHTVCIKMIGDVLKLIIFRSMVNRIINTI